jgi:hypothetical protein
VAKALRILHGEIRTPPMSVEARREAGFLLRQLQEGIALSLPASRPMPEIESGCHELRVKDGESCLEDRLRGRTGCDPDPRGVRERLEEDTEAGKGSQS